MYQHSYSENLAEDPRDCRERERRALSHAIALLEKADAAGARSAIAAEALNFLCRLWRALIDDLTAADNDLPEALRANLVSIGLWIIKETDLIRCGRSENFCGLIEICATIRDGLK